MNAILHTFQNDETGMKSFVVAGAKGKFHVSLQDSDSGMFDSVVMIYPDEARAIAKAKEVL